MRLHIKDSKVLSPADVRNFSGDLEDNYSEKGSEEEYSELFNFYIKHSDDRVNIQNSSRSRSCCEDNNNDYKNNYSNEQKDLDIEINSQRIEKTTIKSTTNVKIEDSITMTIHNKLQNDESTVSSESEVLTSVENTIVPNDNDRQQQSSSIVPYFTIFIIMMNCKELYYFIYI